MGFLEQVCGPLPCKSGLNWSVHGALNDLGSKENYAVLQSVILLPVLGDEKIIIGSEQDFMLLGPNEEWDSSAENLIDRMVCINTRILKRYMCCDCFSRCKSDWDWTCSLQLSKASSLILGIFFIVVKIPYSACLLYRDDGEDYPQFLLLYFKLCLGLKTGTSYNPSPVWFSRD